MNVSASNIGFRNHIKHWRRLILLASIMLFLTITAYAQGESQIKDALRIEKPSLEFKLIALTPTTCIGDPLKLRLEVTNAGQETLKVNRAYFWNSYSESSTTLEGENKEGSITIIWPRSTSEDIFLLAPGKTYVAHKYWLLDKEVIKVGSGHYAIQIETYGTQNKVQFEIHDCKRKEL